MPVIPCHNKDTKLVNKNKKMLKFLVTFLLRVQNKQLYKTFKLDSKEIAKLKLNRLDVDVV